MAFEILSLGRVLGPVCGSLLRSFLDNFDCVDRFVCVCELLEDLSALGVFDGLGPLAEIAIDEFVHLLFHVGADSEFIVHDHFFEVFDSAGEIFDPSCCSLEFVGGADVENQVAVDDGHHHIRWYVCNKQFGVSGLCTSVASNKDVEPNLSSNESKAGSY